MTQHPAAKAAQDRAAANAKKKNEERQAEADLTLKYGLRFVHIRARNALNQILPKGGCTIAYTFAGRDRVNVAVATCHKIDLYSKPIGRLHAADNYDNEKFITLRVPKGLSPVQFLQAAFGWAGQPSVDLPPAGNQIKEWL